MPRASPELWVAALLSAVVGAVILRRCCGWRAAILIASIKCSLVVSYFALYYDGSWTIVDDVTYYRQGRLLLAAGFNPLTVFTSENGFATLLFLSNGTQFLYSWFNLAMQYAYGEHYWAAVFGNVLLTCATAVVLYRFARDVGASEDYARNLALFFALHWELLAWSSFLNVKDLLVMFLTVVLLRALTALSRGFTWTDLWVALLAATLLFVARFYVPVVAIAAFAVYRYGRPQEWGLRSIIAAGALAGLVIYVVSVMPNLRAIISFNPADLAFGWLRTLLSPQPWSLQRGYGFLEVPATLHLITIGFAAYGAYLLYREARQLRLTFVYAALLLLAVAAYPELQGPRHRIQLLFLVAWCQFQGVLAAARELQRRRLAVGGE
jgi:hypothetical protein